MLFQAFWVMPMLAAALNLFGFKRVQAALKRWSRADAVAFEQTRMRDVRQAAILVNAVADRGLYKANCLKRSLALWWLLRRRGIETELRIGVRRGDEGFLAHAWIEYGGHVVNDRRSYVSQFATFSGEILGRYNFVD